MNDTIINIGRQFGSGGRRIAAALGVRLGIPVYDNELLVEAAQKSGFSKDLFEMRDEHKSNFTLSNLFGSINRYGSADSFLNDNRLFKIQSDVILELAQQGPAIFVGRASDYVLREMECLDVFITAPLEIRKKDVAEREGISLEEAESMIAKRDRDREAYYNYLTFGNWGVASNYDLCIDSSILGIEGTADFIVDFGRKCGLIK
ncbi:MAG: cytidylate kinase-like family protein [Bacteroidales bacterium]|jgi:cytidylate kinase|nr:cytidylate kinase-like family protein [Bacteroidales bacterium]MBR4478917.1 cytidylate kinase-like family protein [Bacteroidales bacterium]MBR4568597.1 cytidylate kinase-like family protein [Bacteroidales bacterium]